MISSLLAKFDSIQKYECGGGKTSTRKYYFYYTIFFIIIALLVFSYYIINGKSFVYCDTNEGGDGLVQHYNSFVYYGQYLRNIIKTLIFEHKLEIPMFDLSIGYGQDIITTLSYYVIGDPFSFLSVFIPTSTAEYGYSALILLRIYCSGIAFSMYCRYRGYKSGYTLIGAYIYSFSAYTLLISVLHPYFTLPLIYFPLLLIGAEKVLKKEGNVPFILMIAIAGLSNFYFFYMLCIMLVIYVIFRYVQIFGRIRIREILPWIGKFVLYAVIGVCIAGILLFPSIMSILSSSRISTDTYVPLTYTLKYYLQLFPSFIGGGGNYYSHMGYTALAFISVVIIFVKRKQKKGFKFLCAGFILLMFFLVVPFFGHLFNGFSYVTNRWIWALAFLAAYVTVIALPMLKDLNTKEWAAVLGAAAIEAVVVYAANAARTEKNMNILVMLFAVILILYIASTTAAAKYLYYICVVITIGSIFINATYIYSPAEANYLQNFTDAGEAYQMLTEEAPEYILKSAEDDDIYRFDTAGISTGPVKRNSAMLLGMYGTAFYYSTTSETTSQFISDMYMNYSYEHTYNNLDQRTWLDVLMGVKYFIVPIGKENLLPVIYDEYVTEDDNYVVYTTDNALPFGFTSDVIVSESEYNELTVEQKQQVLLQGIVIDSEEEVTTPVSNLNFDAQNVEYTVTDADGVTYKDGTFEVTSKDATITFSFEGTENSELYIIWEDLDYKSVNPYSLYDDEELSEMSTYERNNLKRSYQYWEEATAVSFTMTAGSRSTPTTIRTNKNTYYAGIHDFLSNLGYSEEADNSVTLKFDTVGTYTFDSMRIICQPMDSFDDYCSSLQEDALENVDISTNEVTGSISLSEDKVLCIQIPYSSGWTAKVDGCETEIFKADGMFIALALSTGDHEIELTYTNPYLKIGMIASLLGLLLLMGYVIIEKKVSP